MMRAFSRPYRRYVLGMLTAVYTLNFLDRASLMLLLQPIKDDLRLSDTQLGFLTGIAFALFYATLGIPIARWADRGNRSTITALAIALWGMTVMSCMLVVNFAQLVCARVAAGIGEAGCMPPTYSLLGDYFPEPAERTRAMAVYWLANPLSALISFIAGGWVNEHYGWRAVFLLLGLPGLIVAVLVRLTVVEPRQPTAATQQSLTPQPAFMDVLRLLWRKKSTRHLSAAIIWLWMTAIGLAQWFAAFMIRSHAVGTAELGVWFGLVLGLGGMAGILLGGIGGGSWYAHDERRQMRVCAVMIAALCPFTVLFLSLSQARLALSALLPWAVVLNFFFGAAFTLLQRLVADQMRATTLAIVMLLANLIGMGVGPQAIGILSDLLTPLIGGESLRYAMLIMSVGALFSGWHFWRVGQSVRNDLEEQVLRETGTHTATPLGQLET